MKENIKRGCLYIMSLVICLNLSGCNLKNSENEKGLEEYNLYEEHFDTYVKKDIVDNSIQKKYKAENIVIGINKETNEVSRYIYYHGDANNYLYNNVMKPEKEGVLTQLFNLDTGGVLYAFSTGDNVNNSLGYDNLEELLEENDFYFIWNLDEDIMMEIYERFDYKAWYTVDEINEIAQIIINKNEKIKKLELNNK